MDRTMRNRLDKLDLRVAVIDSDNYTEQAIHAYLAWDRRTRSLMDYSSLGEFARSMGELKPAQYPDVVILDVNNVGERAANRQSVQLLTDTLAEAAVVCLSHIDDLDMLHAAVSGGARAFLHKGDVGIHISSAVCLAHLLTKQEFLYSRRMDEARRILNHPRLSGRLARLLPRPLSYAGMTARVRRAIELYAIEGMPAELIANEMQLTESTVRAYIKQAYAVLGLRNADDSFLANLSQRERAFRKLTALDLDNFEL